MRHFPLALAWLGIVATTSAQTLTGVSVAPAAPPAGQSAVITATFDLPRGDVNCGVRVRFSDGTPDEYHYLNQLKDVPLVVHHVFARPGDATVWVEPRTHLPAIKCTGGDHSAALKVLPAAR